jgi:hypothetical protein
MVTDKIVDNTISTDTLSQYIVRDYYEDAYTYNTIRAKLTNSEKEKFDLAIEKAKARHNTAV